MTRLRLVFVFCVLKTTALFATMSWEQTNWNGENAYQIETERWRAVVSSERGRLVHFGPQAMPALNLLLSPTDRHNPFGYGGHRVWLGPQQEWAAIWPPPVSWEKAAASEVSIIDDSLRLKMPPSPDGWPQIIRNYRVKEGRLECEVEAQGGTKDCQVMQILRMPIDTEVTVKSGEQPLRDALRVLSSHQRYNAKEALDTFAHTEGNEATFLYRNHYIKLAFPVQTLRAKQGPYVLLCGWGRHEGSEVDRPDEGLYTQLYLGANDSDPVIELEQLSPRWKAGQPNHSTLWIDLIPLP